MFRKKILFFASIKPFFLYLVFIISAICFLSSLLFFLTFLLASFAPLFVSNNAWQSLYGESRSTLSFIKILHIFLFTLKHSLLSSILAVSLGLCAAFFCANRTFKLRSFLLSLSSIPLTLPAIIISLSYILFFGNNGLFFIALDRLFKIKVPSFLYSILGIILVQGFYNFPIAMRFITDSWSSFSQSQKAAATLLGAKPFFIFRSIILPHLMPSILSSFLLIFLFCFFSFVIILLFGGVGVSTIEVELYKCISYSFDFRLASCLALGEFLFGCIMLICYSYFKRKANVSEESISLEEERAKIRGGIERGFFMLLIFLIFFFLVLPIISVFMYSFYPSGYSYGSSYYLSLKAWKNVLSSRIFWQSLLNSVYIGVLVAMLSSLSSIFFCYIKLFFFDKAIMEVISFLPLITSSIMLGFGSRMLVKTGNVVILILAQSSLFWLFSYSRLQESIANIPKNIVDASLILSKDRLRAFFLIILPISKKAIITGAVFVFAISLAETSLPLALGLEGFSTLTLLLFDYASTYRTSESAVLGIILLLVSSLAFWLKDRKRPKD